MRPLARLKPCPFTNGNELSATGNQNDSMVLNMGTLAVVLVGAILFARNAMSLPATPWRIAGLAILIPSFLLWIVARVQLGGAFSVRSKATVLVTTGLYRRIRNPIFVFSALVLGGLIIWMQQPRWFLVFLVLIPLQTLRAWREGKVLGATFGDAYREYKRTTWF